MNKTPKAAVAVIASAPKSDRLRSALLYVIIFGLSTLGLVATLKGQQNCLFTFVNDTGQRACVRMETVRTAQQRQKGLSGRQSLPVNQGMLFIFDQPAQYCMWMKDMLFDLDMIWADAKGQITHIVRDVRPETYPQSFCGEGQYVIEVSAGIADQANLQLGQKLQL